MSETIEPRPPRLRFDPTAWIAPGAVVVGDVALGARASVWFNAVLRGDTDRIEVGDESNLQDGTVVHMDEGLPALVGRRVTIGHRAIIHGCVIEDECLIGMGAILLSGARIGTGSLVGAGALVREGQVVPPGSVVVGAPARVIGPVTADHRGAIARGWSHYVALSRAAMERAFARPHPPVHSHAGVTDRSRGPMTYLEWERLVAVLAESPAWAAARRAASTEAHWRRPEAAGRWSAHDVVCHLRDCDVEVFLPRAERMLAEDRPAVENVDMEAEARIRAYAGDGAERALEDWADARRRLVAVLAPLGPAEWARHAVHSLHGAYPLAEMVRYWSEHDLSHRRQIARALTAAG